MIISPALMLQPKADAFRMPAPGAFPNPQAGAALLGQQPTTTPPLFMPAAGTAGLKLAVSRIRQFGGQLGPAKWPRPNMAARAKATQVSVPLPDTTYPEVKQRAIIRQPAALTNARPWWEGYLYD